MEILKEIAEVSNEIKLVENRINNMEKLDHDKLDVYSRQLFDLKRKLQRLEKVAYLELEPKYTSDEIDLYIKNIHVTLEGDVPDIISYLITLHGTKEIIGEIDVRYSLLESEKYLGNIGAEIKGEYRGKRYSKKAFCLLKDSMLENGLIKPIFTVNVDNTSSIKSLSAIGAERVEYVNDGDNQYYVYEYDLEKDRSK